MSDKFYQRRSFYIPTALIAMVLGIYYLTKYVDFLTLPFLCIILIIVTTLEVIETKKIKSKENILKLGSAGLLIALATWYQITVFIL
ncbi:MULTISPECIES: hypothetical protein [Oceanobacillus]|uniref:DUF3953 domain-containing protein n=1 Tax=Oceanobacillus kimchii TaxID=746691 RepID=A0ABQ5TJI3_9BACI|nr:MULTISPECIES: hypothetical protein [Oceanobacillus]MBT2598583.1 hypothetical protein [Oceanobacillus sp. ISL-74]MBT2651501.1 hypothetical protein [Oceanobacillus sp. ISL-73]MCT1576159.1 hypothetical protein [Oceanobacillus kimchii]MCT2135796.1 hypothetical protein [Oceanobacillus kimchii]OEH55886.1 hypothetical protein AQ616_06830 [Oceanobacillus sp. E9]